MLTIHTADAYLETLGMYRETPGVTPVGARCRTKGGPVTLL
jgi:hypothetical protein